MRYVGRFVDAQDIVTKERLDAAIAGLVPYAGATATVNLGTYSLTAGLVNLPAGGKIITAGSGSLEKAGTDNYLQLVTSGDSVTTIPPGTRTLAALSNANTWTANQTVNGNILVTGTVDGRDVSVDGTKLDGIAAGATVNSTDATLLARANHTGTQAISTVTGLQTALDSKAADSDVVKTAGSQTIAGTKTFSGRSSHAGAYTPSALPAHSATPTFDCSTGNVFEPAELTANVTAITLSNPVAGQTVQIRFLQDATGGRTVVAPSGAKVSGSIATAANRVSWLVLTYSSRGARWEGNWLQVPA